MIVGPETIARSCPTIKTKSSTGLVVLLVMTFGLGLCCRGFVPWNTTTPMTTSQGVLLVLLVVLSPLVEYWHGWCRDWWMQRMQLCRTQRSTARQTESNLKLTGLLASIGAPPPLRRRVLRLPRGPSHGNTTYIKGDATSTTTLDTFLEESIDLVICFRNFLWTVDTFLERLQSATSMKLGLGIWSPAVNRMELNRQHNVWGGNEKRMLARVLLRCRAALRHNDEDNNDASGAAVVVTLSWLQSTRHQLVEALSDYLGGSSDTTVPQLKQSRAMIEQLHIYLCAAMESFRGEQCPETKDSPSSLLGPVAQHLHAAEIALWAYAQETTTIENNNQDDETTTSTAAAKREWVQRFYALLKVAQSLHDETCNTMDAAAAAVANPQQEAETSSSHSSWISSNTLLNFEDDGIRSGNMEHNQRKPPICNDTTLVFSGKGCVEKKRKVMSVASSMMPSGVAPTATNSAMTQTMLMQELRTRLAAMEHRIEVDATTSTAATEVLQDEEIDDEAPITELVTEDDGAIFSMPKFLLTELQSSIRIQLPQLKEEPWNHLAIDSSAVDVHTSAIS